MGKMLDNVTTLTLLLSTERQTDRKTNRQTDSQRDILELEVQAVMSGQW